MKKVLISLILISEMFFGVFANDLQNTESYLDYSFFEKLNDEILLNNIQKGIENNVDLKIAVLKVKESEKIVKMSLAQELPRIDFDGDIGKIFSSSDILRGKNNYMVQSYSQTNFLLPLIASYEVDIWGKNRLKTKSFKQSEKMLKQDERTVYIVLTTAIAFNYYNLIKIDKLIELENENLNLTNKLLTLVENKQKNGLASKDEVLEVKQNVIQIKSNINELNLKKEVLENQIAYLINDKFFNKVERNDFSNVVEFSNIPEEFNSEIILNRPDVIFASENIIKVNYESKIAKKDLLPSFTITGTFGFSGYNNLAGIFKNHTGLAQIFVSPNLNLFDGGRKYNFMKLKQLELERAKEEYEKAVLSSIQEVNDSLAVLKNENKNYKLSKEISDIQSEKLRLKENNKLYGLSSEIDLILYKKIKILSDEKLVNDKINQTVSLVNVYKALGGHDFIKEEML